MPPREETMVVGWMEAGIDRDSQPVPKRCSVKFPTDVFRLTESSFGAQPSQKQKRHVSLCNLTNSLVSQGCAVAVHRGVLSTSLAGF